MANGSFHGDLLSDHKTTTVSLTHKEKEAKRKKTILLHNTTLKN
jgi:hypothetical protein